MLFLKRFFGTGKPSVLPETSDRTDYDVGRGLTPEAIDRIMTTANTGDPRDQCLLARSILEKNADIMQALSTRVTAVAGCPWRIEPGDDSPAAAEAAEALRKSLAECGDGDDADTFDDLLEDLMGALLPGFAVSEILWLPGGGIAGFRHIEQHHFTFLDGFTPRLATSDAPGGVELPRDRIVFHRLRMHGGDPARGGLIRPLAWLHVFKHVGEKDLLGFIERHGMPFIAAKVDPSAFDQEKNLVKRLIRNFGSSGGGIFTRNVELQLLECKNNGDAYFRLLEYLEAAVNKVILGQTASSGDSSGLSKGDAQSKVRQDVLEGDCRRIMRVVNAQLIKPWAVYNIGPGTAVPGFVIDCAPPEDREQLATVVKTLYDAGFDTDPEEVGKRVGLKLQRTAPAAAESGPETGAESAKTLDLKQKYEAMGISIRGGFLTATPEIEECVRRELGLSPMSDDVRKAWAATGGIRQPITLKAAEEAAVSEVLDVDDTAAAAKPIAAMSAESRPDDPLEEWLGPVRDELAALAGEDIPEDEFKSRLLKLASGAGFGSSEKFEKVLENVICTGIAAGYAKTRRTAKK